jgi:YggT family protein
MEILRTLVLVYILCIFLVIVLSWFPQQAGTPTNQAFNLLRRVTDPVLVPLRRLIPPVGGVLDLSPMIVLFVLFAIYNAL